MTWLKQALGLSDEQLQAIEASITKRESDYRLQQLENAKRKATDEDEYGLDQSMADKALSGVYGPQCKDLAFSHVEEHGRSAQSLRSLRRTLSKVEGRQCG